MTMKVYKISYILLLFCFIYGCKKDLGNYDYRTVEQTTIDTTGIGGAKSVLRYSNMQLQPKVNIPAGHQVAYEWLFYSRNIVSGVVPTVRVLSTTLNLDAVIGEAVGNYYLELVVTDMTTKLKTNVLFDVAVSANMEYGMLALYENANGGDIDLLKSPLQSSTNASATHLKQLFSASYGQALTGKPKFIWASRFSAVNWITVGTENHIYRFSGTDFSFIREQLDMFRRNSTQIAPQAYVYSIGYYEVLINNGRFHVNNSTAELDAKFGGPGTGNYSLAPFLSENTTSTYAGVGYDEIGSRFVRFVPASLAVIDFQAPADNEQPFDLRNIGKDMLFMTGGAGGNTYSFFKDKAGSGRWLYVTNFNNTFDNGRLAVNRFDMTSLPEIEQAQFYQASGLASYAYYATKTKIYNYTYNNGAANIAFSVPAGEEITAMKYYRPRPRTGLLDREERILYVATYNGTNGKVYELSINETSGIINSTPANVFEIDGKVIDLATKVL
ncbi:PKD-like family lipoprotein [Sphingobacterium griseoflavum]|uniref:PKD-like family protein n=1 Tax=Sphingobacterium griseoflavum TaxID=1474952 RepID=A0ABQ3I0G3_9SPHI|nr:PKD-like family lipoprotein [Sphingobacterium griseoflavum]GHE45916.1 hypothetical protein GCM10017764_31510 [Sphingobacterium griseoflavum]